MYPDSIIPGLTFRSNGSIDYIPRADSCYTLSFRYQVVVNGRDEEACRDFAQVNVKVVKNEAPSLLNVPSDVNLTCVEKPTLPNVRAVNSCNEEIEVNMTETEFTLFQVPCTYRFSRTWTAIDACGNMASATCSNVAKLFLPLLRLMQRMIVWNSMFLSRKKEKIVIVLIHLPELG